MISRWMSWEGGVDLCGLTRPDLPMPNVIVHVARLVHTPKGSSPSGMVLYQPDPAAPPVVMGFVGHDAGIGAYFGPSIFAGTPFETAPVLPAKIEVVIEAGSARATIEVAGHVFATHLRDLAPLELVSRPPAPMTPFHQQGLEAGARQASLTVDGKPVSLVLPPQGLSGGPAAVWAPAGLYAR